MGTSGLMERAEKAGLMTRRWRLWTSPGKIQGRQEACHLGSARARLTKRDALRPEGRTFGDEQPIPEHLC